MGVVLFVLLGGFLGGRLTSPATPPEVQTVEVRTKCPIAAPPLKPENFDLTEKALNSCMEALSQMAEKIAVLQQHKDDCLLDLTRSQTESDEWRKKFVDYPCGGGSE